jgi:hypothetical protein
MAQSRVSKIRLVTENHSFIGRSHGKGSSYERHQRTRLRNQNFPLLMSSNDCIYQEESGWNGIPVCDTVAGPARKGVCTTVSFIIAVLPYNFNVMQTPIGCAPMRPMPFGP